MCRYGGLFDRVWSFTPTLTNMSADLKSALKELVNFMNDCDDSRVVHSFYNPMRCADYEYVKDACDNLGLHCTSMEVMVGDCGDVHEHYVMVSKQPFKKMDSSKKGKQSHSDKEDKIEYKKTMLKGRL